MRHPSHYWGKNTFHVLAEVNEFLSQPAVGNMTENIKSCCQE